MTANILDPLWKYTPSAATNIRKTFARIRKEQRAQKEAEIAAATNVKVISRKAK